MTPTPSDRPSPKHFAAARLAAMAVFVIACAGTCAFADHAPSTQPAKDASAPSHPGTNASPAPQITPAPAPARPALTAKKAVQDFDKMMQGETEEDLGDDPLGTVAERITDVHADLAQMKTNRPVQEKQQQVVADLDLIIKKLTPKGGGNSGHIPGEGRKRSIIVAGDPAFGDLHGVDPRRSEWAKLPPKQRDQILQSRTEGFPAGYDALLQSYYRRLAQEKPVDDQPAPPAPPPSPAPAKP